jgi:hypothetical protein
MKEIIEQLRSVVRFCGFELNAIQPKQNYISMDLTSKKRFRKKNYVLGVSTSLTGLLAAERELSRSTKSLVIIFDPVNNLLEPTLDSVKLFHEISDLQAFLNE